MRICILLTLLLASPLLADEPRDTIEINLKREWHFSGFSPGQTKVAERYAMNLQGECPDT